ncbi:anti-sigma factor family protein [Haliangium sp.]|uniref:anti-sigma factor family protein n=1 Tax=Haliangium sp. TaxID=2663208 RepID=UPI003D0BBF0E
MTAPGAHEPLHPDIESQFSELYERSLSPDSQRSVEEHLASCEVCRRAYEEFRETMSMLSGLHKMAAPQDFERDVEETIRRRSAGRFFGRRAFGDRVPYELLAILVLVVGVAIFFLLRGSQTGSLRYDKPREAPQIAPGAREVIPQPAPISGESPAPD